MHRSVVVALCAVLVSLACERVLAQPDDGGPPPADVVIEAARTERLINARGVTGEIRSLLRSQLAAQVAGLVVEMDVEEGDRVEAGDVVARLDDERARASLDRASSEVAAAEAEIEQRTAELDEARRDLSRQRELEARGSVNRAELDAAETLVSSRAALLARARADLGMARADLVLARRTLADMRIEAPFGGRVVRTSTDIGEWVGVGVTVCTIVSLEALEARIDVPEGIVWALERSGEPVELALPAVRGPMHGSVLSVVPEADSLSRLFPVRLEVEDPEGVLRPGMSLTAMVPTGDRRALLTVSKDAVLRNDAGAFVYINRGGVAQVAPIERRFSVGDRVVIRSAAVREGTEVVVVGNERLFPGQPLRAVEEAPGDVVNESSGASASGGGGSGEETGDGGGASDGTIPGAGGSFDGSSGGGSSGGDGGREG